MSQWVVGLEQADAAQVARVGGKGAQLARLAQVEGARVPPGFCVTTDAFRSACAAMPELDRRLVAASGLSASDRDAIAALSADLGSIVGSTPVPAEIAAAITAAVEQRGARVGWAVRSSATAEDLPTASYAGLYDSFLHVVGPAEVLDRVRSCWASAFTARALAYRLRAGRARDPVAMGVVVQHLLAPDAAGVCFTAHPVRGDRTVTAIEATWGLGESLVAGLVNPDVYEVRAGQIIRRSIGEKAVAIEAAPEGGTRRVEVGADRRGAPALSDADVLRLEALGRRVEAAFGHPVDLEWAVAGGALHLVQCRPIPSLFPIPAGPPGEGRVYLSVGHQQMMTDPMKPLGLSVFRLTALRPMYEAAGRLFVDVIDGLASPARAALLDVFRRGDPLTHDAVRTLLVRAEPALVEPPAVHPPIPAYDPAEMAAYVARGRASVGEASRVIFGAEGPARFDRIVDDIGALKRQLTEPSAALVMSAMQAAWWLDDHLAAWLGEKSAADVLTRSVANNVTSEMGLALLDVADVIRAHPDAVTQLRGVTDDAFVERMPPAVRTALTEWLAAYGMRCVGEIDLTRPRWAERPSSLLPVVLGYVDRFAPGEAARRFARGRAEAEARAAELLDRLRALPDGEEKAAAARARIDHLRSLIGYREFPKYLIVSRYFVYKQAILDAIRPLVRSGALAEAQDADWLTFDELREAVRTGEVDATTIRRRREAHVHHLTLTPPRVITSDGECVVGSYHRAAPPGAWIGLPVSAGVVEGRARVVVDLADATLEAGDILVTRFTDPSWTPAFVAVAGLVTEVGGQMTHGAVIAREYGLPAVVGVPDATRRIRDGQRIRVHGTEGWIEPL